MTPSTRNRPSSPSRLAKALRASLPYAGSIVVLYVLFHLLSGRQVFRALASLPAGLWIFVFAAYLATHCIGVAKYRLVLRLAGAPLDYRQSSRCYFAGLFGSLFLPSLIGGDVFRAALAMRVARSKAAVLLGSLADRILDFTALALLALAGAMLVPGRLSLQSKRPFLWLAVGLTACGLALALAFFPARRFSYRMRRRLARLRRAARSMSQRPSAVLGALGLGLCVQVVFISLSLALARACGLHVDFREWLFAWPLAKLSAAIPITQGGVGVREAALAALLLPFGAPAALSVAAGLAWEAVVVAGALCGGAYSFGIRHSAANSAESAASAQQ